MATRLSIPTGALETAARRPNVKEPDDDEKEDNGDNPDDGKEDKAEHRRGQKLRKGGEWVHGILNLLGMERVVNPRLPSSPAAPR